MAGEQDNDATPWVPLPLNLVQKLAKMRLKKSHMLSDFLCMQNMVVDQGHLLPEWMLDCLLKSSASRAYDIMLQQIHLRLNTTHL